MIKKISNLKKIIKQVINESRFIMSQNNDDLSSLYNNDFEYKSWYVYFSEVLPNIILNNKKIIFIEYGEYYLTDLENFNITILSDEEYANIGKEIQKINLPTNLFQISFKLLNQNKQELYNKYTQLIPSEKTIFNINGLYLIFEKLQNIKDKIDDNSNNLEAKNMSKNIGSEINFIDFNSKDDCKDYLYDIAGPDVFISFIDAYEHDITTNEMKVPSFSLNPNANFSTPHGIYAYPFDRKNASSFIKYGQPTRADFGADRDYFHLIQIDLNHPNVFIINKDESCNKNISYEKYIKNIKELMRIHKNFFKLDFDDSILFEDLNEAYEEISEHGDNNFIKLYKFAYFLSFKECSTTDNIADLVGTGTNFSELYALLLHSIGIKCVVDNDASMIHYNEPEQMHIITFGDDKSFYKYIGTFKNMFSNRLYDDMYEDEYEDD
jgi:hypothetical protein